MEREKKEGEEPKREEIEETREESSESSDIYRRVSSFQMEYKVQEIFEFLTYSFLFLRGGELSFSFKS